jgi:class 3 adenylate cyclase
MKLPACPITKRTSLSSKDKHCIFTSFAGKISEKCFRKVKKDGRLLGDLARGVEKDVTIMFADVRDFTRTTADMPPGRIVQLLDTLLPELLHIIIEKHGGMVDKILGDGVMAAFGHPYSDGMDLELGIQAAADKQSAIGGMGPVFDRLGLPRLRLGIGMNHGKVLVCHIGSRQHSENTFIGSAVNMAAKMEDIAMADEVVIASGASRHLQGKASPMARHLQPIESSKYGPGHARILWRELARGTT